MSGTRKRTTAARGALDTSTSPPAPLASGSKPPLLRRWGTNVSSSRQGMQPCSMLRWCLQTSRLFPESPISDTRRGRPCPPSLGPASTSACARAACVEWHRVRCQRHDGRRPPGPWRTRVRQVSKYVMYDSSSDHAIASSRQRTREFRVIVLIGRTSRISYLVRRTCGTVRYVCMIIDGRGRKMRCRGWL